MKSSLLQELLGLKSKLEDIEKEVLIQNNIEETQEIIINTHNVEQKLEDFFATKDQVVSLNIGGKIFLTKEATILGLEGTLFHSILTKSIEENQNPLKEMFFDRSSTYFPVIMNYLRTKQFSHKKLTKIQKEELMKEMDYYGINVSKNKKSFDIEWDMALSKPNMFTINIDDPRKIRLHSTTCYTHFLTNRIFTDESFIVELESTVTQTDNYYYLGIINESYNTTSSCGCCNPANSFYIQCDGSTHINGTRVENSLFSWGANQVTVTLKVNIHEKTIYFSVSDKGELGPFTITGNTFRVYAGHCNTGNGEINITECYEI